MTAALLPTRWPRIAFTDSARDRFDEVAAFLDTLKAEHHPLHDEIQAAFTAKLDYLDSYGGSVSDQDDRRRFRIALGRDWSPHSFSVVWEQLNPQTGEYRYAFNGGLIWHGGSNDPLTVSLTSQWFGIHT